jgi:high-affinity Fe2+/Pb2+ permease
MMALPLVALVKNSTDAGAKLPRWVAWLLVAAAIGVGFLLAWTSIGITLGD